MNSEPTFRPTLRFRLTWQAEEPEQRPLFTFPELVNPCNHVGTGTEIQRTLTGEEQPICSRCGGLRR